MITIKWGILGFFQLVAISFNNLKAPLFFQQKVFLLKKDFQLFFVGIKILHPSQNLKKKPSLNHMVCKTYRFYNGFVHFHVWSETHAPLATTFSFALVTGKTHSKRERNTSYEFDNFCRGTLDETSQLTRLLITPWSQRLQKRRFIVLFHFKTFFNKIR